ncbi:hypothetical protein K5X82_00105 [Halosquirtibacter xylanolyticus]|uniref:thiamine pyrophosphate-binding protein n=1 Tax=Halosquirtibacter xylanolyticus TaxID=3374599 RepID=UPI003748C9A8|nr:hypothetical protein K5X82_00105 [Prolixibacteraceae bacterium]
MKITVSDYLLRRLKELNVNHLFGIPGDYVLPFFDRILDGDHGVEHIGVTNELNGTYNADGYSKANGYGAMAVTFGPGSLNATNAIEGAYADDIPLLLIAGSPTTEVLNKKTSRLYHHVIGTNFNANIEVMTPITIQAKRIEKLEMATAIIDDMLIQSSIHKKPAYLELPFDIQTQLVDAPVSSLDIHHRGNDNKMLEEVVNQIMTLIAQSKSRAILVGHIVQRTKKEAELLHIVETIGASVATTFVGKNGTFESLSQSVGLYMGAVSEPIVKDAIENSDILLSMGVTENEFDTGVFTNDYSNTEVVQILRDHVIINGNRYDNVYIEEVVDRIHQISNGLAQDYTPIDGKKFFYEPSDVKVTEDKPITIDVMMPMFANYFQEEDVVFGEVGGYINMSQAKFPKNTFIQGNGNWASLGSGFASFVGATFSELYGRRFIALLGDGGFQMTAQETSSLLKYNKDVALFVFNNSGYAAERAIHPGVYRSYNDIQVWNYELLPKAFGGEDLQGKGYQVSTEKELETVLELLTSPKGVNIVNIHLDPNDLAAFNVAFSSRLKH